MICIDNIEDVRQSSVRLVETNGKRLAGVR